MIVETATVHHRDGRAVKFVREKGRKQFTMAQDSESKVPLGYSRRRLEERPQKDRGVERVSFAKGAPC